MSIACVWIPAFRLAVARLTNTIDPGAPVILANRRERGRVLERSDAAAELGVQVGMTLTQAQAAAPGAHVLVEDPASTSARWTEVLDALDAASPLVEDAGWGLAFLEMHGIGGGAAGWVAAVRAALASFDLPLQVGLGPNPFVARAAALAGDGVICTGDPASFVRPFSLELLDAGHEIRERLGLLGLHTLGDLAALPHGPFVRRFGPQATRWHEHARGIDRRRLCPRPRALRIDRRLVGEGEARSEEAVLFALRTLVGYVVDDLGAAGKRAGRLVLALECENGDVREVATGVAMPTAQPTTLFDLLRTRLEGITLDAPVVGLRLAAEQLEDGGVPLTLFAGREPDPDTLGIVLARLNVALGDGHALRPRVTAGARIERRYAFDPFALTSGASTTWSGASPSALPASTTLQFRMIAPRAVSVQIAAGRPALVGSPAQRVMAYAGPWRIDEGWWAPAGRPAMRVARDEYDVLLEDGTLVRIARERTAWSVRGIYD